MAMVVTVMRQLVLLCRFRCFTFFFSPGFRILVERNKVSSGAPADFPEATELAEFLPAGLGKG